VLTSRSKAITQVLGYLTLENGVYAFGATVAFGMPILVELGILLDVFVGVFVMGIAIFHISRQFDHIDTDQFVSRSDRA
jgi:hydrogenase-4 component E